MPCLLVTKKYSVSVSCCVLQLTRQNETMSAKDPTGITIPSVFVSDAAGYMLMDLYNYTSGYYVMVNDDVPFNINTHLLLPFAVVVVLCLVIILISMIVKCVRERRRLRRQRLPNKFLNKIPTCKFSKSDPYDTCAICLDDYQEGDRLRVLPCAHAYHAKCVDPWLTQNRRVCPVCKRRVYVGKERRTADSDSSADDTSPLMDDDRESTNTQSGTFAEQRENPFVRATRLMRRLRRRLRREQASQEGQEPTQEAEVQPDEMQQEQAHSDTEALLPRAALVAERPRRQRRRSRSARTRPVVVPPPLREGHSINTEGGEGEIGVAALPAPPLASSTPHHLNL
ncbi:E3 ubiquitin-protein ligase Godzilla-like isoform X1 [Amyelois transitella]|uniref:E3 ubiquitin-protein ligase Godzilla-like isoform X1 n=2 Tax=Amyelois transitella TaxID=680683 RepID=UPI00298FFFBD|nr:E3 ubiquitin-protein ligase Godzilla-like isoform X1 [Amyelois transitella]